MAGSADKASKVKDLLSSYYSYNNDDEQAPAAGASPQPPR